jgi:hypothetical protein
VPSENLYIRGQLCAVVITLDDGIGVTEFFTQDDSILQVGQIALNSEKHILAHRHLPVPRATVGTNEVLVVLKGKLKMHLYGDSSDIEITKEISEGQAVLLVGGGHAFESDTECKILEIKNGPFWELGDKEYLK